MIPRDAFAPGQVLFIDQQALFPLSKRLKVSLAALQRDRANAWTQDTEHRNLILPEIEWDNYNRSDITLDF